MGCWAELLAEGRVPKRKVCRGALSLCRAACASFPPPHPRSEVAVCKGRSSGGLSSFQSQGLRKLFLCPGRIRSGKQETFAHGSGNRVCGACGSSAGGRGQPSSDHLRGGLSVWLACLLGTLAKKGWGLGKCQGGENFSHSVRCLLLPWGTPSSPLGQSFRLLLFCRKELLAGTVSRLSKQIGSPWGKRLENLHCERGRPEAPAVGQL